jgi:hypothetical protein
MTDEVCVRGAIVADARKIWNDWNNFYMNSSQQWSVMKMQDAFEKHFSVL